MKVDIKVNTKDNEPIHVSIYPSADRSYARAYVYRGERPRRHNRMHDMQVPEDTVRVRGGSLEGFQVSYFPTDEVAKRVKEIDQAALLLQERLTRIERAYDRVEDALVALLHEKDVLNGLAEGCCCEEN